VRGVEATKSDKGAGEEEMFRRSGRKSKARGSGLRAALALALALTACSSGGDNGDSTTPCSNMTFAESITAPASGDVFLRDLSSIYGTCATIDVQVLVNDLTDIYTVGFDLTYPSTLVRYEGYALGPLLLQGSPANQPYALVIDAAGSLEVTASRLGADPGVDAAGQQVLMVLHFSRLTSGAGMIDFNLSGTPVGETILGGPPNFNSRPASFGPNHGGLLTVPM